MVSMAKFSASVSWANSCYKLLLCVIYRIFGSVIFVTFAVAINVTNHHDTCCINDAIDVLE